MQLLCLKLFLLFGSTAIQDLFSPHIFAIVAATVFWFAQQTAGRKHDTECTEDDDVADRFHNYYLYKSKTKYGGSKLFGRFI